MMQAEVAVNAPVHQTYSYLIGDLPASGDPAETLIGRRVYVPFGAGRTSGYIIGVASTPASMALKEIIELLDEAPLFHSDMVELFRWMARYYHAPIGQVIKTALPGGLKSGSQTTLCLTNRKCFAAWRAANSDGDDHLWLSTLEQQGCLSPRESARILASPHDRGVAARLLRAGAVTAVKSSGRDAVGKKLERCYLLSNRFSREMAASTVVDADGAVVVADCFARLTGRQPKKAEVKTVLLIRDLLLSSGSDEVPQRELYERYAYAGKIIPGLINAGIVAAAQRRVYRTPFGELMPHYPRVTRYTTEQVAAIEQIDGCLTARRFTTYLLHGITGSGKTEVYLAAAEKALADGRGVLILVPEIALATQIEAHFVSRFGPLVAVLHSGLSPGERFDEWSRILDGTARVVIGARSAVFAPLPDLGLVVVDEEHDGSFKQQDGLRYHARDVAIVRAQMKNSAVILGSATPSVLSYYHGSSGKYRLLTMHHRVGGRSLPAIRIVDMKRQLGGTAPELFHPDLSEALCNNLERGKQSILLLNRRGFSASMVCLQCGSMVECRHCKVTLNLHKQPPRLLCHYCGFVQPVRVRCAGCGSERLQPVGVGTQRVAEAVATLLPEARIARLDSDTATDRRAFLAILQAAGKREIDVLIGTQMLAKGLHFPEVTLVGIVMADSGLGFPDYRAAEKTYQLIAQVAGRAGRGDTPGQVFIQTLQPEHYAIELAARHRYEDLVEQEIAIRRSVGFPPFTRLVFILVEDRREQEARNKATDIAQAARQWLKEQPRGNLVTVLGPAPAAIEKIRERYRWQLLLKAADTERLHRLVDYLAESFKKPGVERMLIDVDPDNML